MLISGLDLGKQSDYAAFATLDRQPLPPPHPPKRRWKYDVRWLHAWELGTDYTVIAEDVRVLYDRPQLSNSKLAVDATGVGMPTYDMIRSKRPRCGLTPIMTTGGKLSHKDPKSGIWMVPKADLVAVLVVLLQGGYIKIDERLPLAARLARELKEFRVKITAAANETFGADGNHHDDLVSAVARAAWLGEIGGVPTDGIGSPPAGQGSVIESAPPGVFADRYRK
jgi:hypothetical protein